MNIKHKFIEKITITGKMEESHKAFDYCRKNGYRVVYSGPKVSRDRLHADVTKFKIIAEREVEIEKS